MIETKGLTKAFSKFIAVDHIDLNISAGAIHGFIGPNGAGKTTTIKMLIGATRCTSGEALINGHPVGSVPARQLMGYAPEQASFYRQMTSTEYLIYMARICGVVRKEAELKAERLLQWLELGKFAHTKVKGFSAGMRQRLALAQALIHDPELLILDEPTANMDPTGRMQIIDNLKQICHERKVTIFISSHILSELEQLVDSVTLIDHGRIVAEDSIDRLKKTFTQNHYVLKTSKNVKVLVALKQEGCVEDSWIDDEGFIHLVNEDGDALKLGVAKTVFKLNALLDYFSEERISLEDVYRKTVAMEEK
ncbi:MAG: ABC transporter ATP-binding protein [Chloroflexota bacterium]|nr:ABC transporter ATP-binding protein [Chloroflexota bacterium]